MLREVFMVILPVILWQNSYSGLSLDVTIVSGVSMLRLLSGLRYNREMCFEWNEICLFHLVFTRRNTHDSHNRYVSAWSHVIPAEFGNMTTTGPHHVTLVHRNSGYGTLLKDNTCTNGSSVRCKNGSQEAETFAISRP